AWSERGVGPGGDSRIMISASQDGINWSASVPVDNKPLTDSNGNQLNPTAMGHGHQLMPAMTFIGGKRGMVEHAFALSGTQGVFPPPPLFVPDPHGFFLEEARQYVGDLLNT